MSTVLRAQQLTKSYSADDEPVQALRGVDLDIRQGEFVSVMGPSGCGKSTLLHLLGGLDRADGGDIWLNGEKVTNLGESAWSKLRRRSVGYMFQFFNLVGGMTAAENVELPALIAGFGPRHARQRREELFAELGISDRARALPSRLSGGEQQRVALARALVNEPDVLLADEPTGNLDSRSAREVMSLLDRVHGNGQTVLLVTHDSRVAAAGDRVIRMRDGQIVSDTELQGGGSGSASIAELVPSR